MGLMFDSHKSKPLRIHFPGRQRLDLIKVEKKGFCLVWLLFWRWWGVVWGFSVCCLGKVFSLV